MGATMTRAIQPTDLKSISGLRRAAVDAILDRQPRTVTEAIQIPNVGRKIAGVLLEARLITDPDDAMHRSINERPLPAAR